ncbi:unnamed protein product [Urochloa decumbens]|uniref:DUF295 domain-containing protein n=1 Tax=Urochloa decumbens TaxID=240449 RepID=A0ABC9ESP6_9POAL
MAGWSSLPADLVNRVADRLLAATDLDYYMALRAVCHGWRSATADPKASPRRFLPRLWTMLDEVHQTDARLFVNAATGRFVRKDLPLLRGYFVVAGAGGGAIVLAERAAPHAARVLNPFTGSLLRFEAPVPSERVVSAHVIGSGSSSLTLVLICDESGTIYWANPDSACFVEFKQNHYAHPLIKLALVGAIYDAAAREDGLSMATSLLVSSANKILTQACKPLADYSSSSDQRQAGGNRCFLVESAGEMLIVFKLPDQCLSVDADKFPSVEANCVYYVVNEPLYDICIYSLEDGKEVLTGGAIDPLNPFTLSPKVSPPFTVVQLLCSYTFEVRNPGLRWDKMLGTLSALYPESVACTDELFAYDCESEDDY